MSKFKIGDKVKYILDYQDWNGKTATVTSVKNNGIIDVKWDKQYDNKFMPTQFFDWGFELMTKFKVGDRVRYFYKSMQYTGQTGTVREVREDKLLVDWDNKYLNSKYQFSDYVFELIKECKACCDWEHCIHKQKIGTKKDFEKIEQIKAIKNELEKFFISETKPLVTKGLDEWVCSPKNLDIKIQSIQPKNLKSTWYKDYDDDEGISSEQIEKIMKKKGVK